MPKKKSKIKHPRSKINAATIFLLGIGFLLVSIVLTIFGSNLAMFRPCANSISCIKDLSGKYQPNADGIFLGKRIAPPQYIASQVRKNNVLGENTSKRHIYVDLTSQMLFAYEADKLIFSYPVSTGKWNHTPTGDFTIWIKLRYTRMSGGSGADYYNLPNVPYTMFFYNSQVPKSDGFSIHGAYWHNNFGHPMSHGCVNMRPVDAGKIYDWANPSTQGNVTRSTDDNPGTTVTIYGTTPIN